MERNSPVKDETKGDDEEDSEGNSEAIDHCKDVKASIMRGQSEKESNDEVKVQARDDNGNDENDNRRRRSTIPKTLPDANPGTEADDDDCDDNLVRR